MLIKLLLFGVGGGQDGGAHGGLAAAGAAAGEAPSSRGPRPAAGPGALGGRRRAEGCGGGARRDGGSGVWRWERPRGPVRDGERAAALCEDGRSDSVLFHGDTEEPGTGGPKGVKDDMPNAMQSD